MKYVKLPENMKQREFFNTFCPCTLSVDWKKQNIDALTKSASVALVELKCRVWDSVDQQLHAKVWSGKCKKCNELYWSCDVADHFVPVVVLYVCAVVQILTEEDNQNS